MKRIVAILAALVVVFSGCSRGNDMVRVNATFTDVGDLFVQAPVMFADIRVGEVTRIRLVGTEAQITMKVDPAADVPKNVVARVRRTSVLGERVIDLVIPEDTEASADSLADGQTISRTEIRADLENLVVEGTDIFGALGASEIATMIDTGARGFGGRGEDLGTLLVNFRDITKEYSGETKRIARLIDNLNEFNATVATRTEAHKTALRNTARAIEVLDDESLRLERALASLARLATGSRVILDAHVDEMDRFFDQLHVVVRTLRQHQTSIEKLLLYAPRHNRNTQLVEYLDFNQILQDFVICGFNDNPEDPARRCKGDG